MALKFVVFARGDVKDVHDHIALNDRSAASRVVGRARASAWLLAVFPRIGRRGSVEGIYEWLVTGLPYIIVYEIDMNSGNMVVLAVFHTARDRP